jgi:hypothetical protein
MWNIGKQFSGPNDHLDSRIADAALDATQVRPVDTGFFGEFVLRKTPFGAELRDVPAEGGQRFISIRHRAHIAPIDASQSVDYRLQILLWLDKLSDGSCG